MRTNREFLCAAVLLLLILVTASCTQPVTSPAPSPAPPKATDTPCYVGSFTCTATWTFTPTDTPTITHTPSTPPTYNPTVDIPMGLMVAASFAGSSTVMDLGTIMGTPVPPMTITMTGNLVTLSVNRTAETTCGVTLTTPNNGALPLAYLQSFDFGTYAVAQTPRAPSSITWRTASTRSRSTRPWARPMPA